MSLQAPASVAVRARRRPRVCTSFALALLLVLAALVVLAGTVLVLFAGG